ncbi:hypothetical protein EV182_005986 [Spiromyces aspiralis]|uniref:Uncharacterized protein n=1 Tax=Spiromyces aspiralis TaxID=68401 RepID=A0ACC1HLS6_9FUNG|nr:hypothetical protein EV182_005986 [Spiromyces aspiralis]
MVDSLKCTLDTSSDVDGDAVGKILGYICGGDSSLCAPISGSPTNGTYGIYSACSPNQRTSFVLNASYLAQNGGKDACTFEGLKTKVVKSPTQDPNSCKKKAESALTNSGGSKGSSGSDGDSDLQSSASPLLASLSALSVVAAAVLL